MGELDESKLDLLLTDVPWPVGLAARMIAASAYPKSRRRSDKASGSSPSLPGDSTRAHTLSRPYELSSFGRTLTDVIVERRSGGMRSGSLDNAELSTLLAATAAPLPHVLLHSPLLGPIVFPLVFDVEDIPPGVYRYVPAQHVILPVRSIQRNAVRDVLLLQREHGEGAAILFIVVPMAEWLHHLGDRGYRGAALQVGYLTDRLYLAAETLGLTYTASGGFAPARADELLDLDSYHYTTMFSFVIGARRPQQGLGSSNEG
jgi:SagB-type dehydrogenase family enzyme